MEWEAFNGLDERDFEEKLRELKVQILKTQKAMKRLTARATARPLSRGSVPCSLRYDSSRASVTQSF